MANESVLMVNENKYLTNGDGPHVDGDLVVSSQREITKRNVGTATVCQIYIFNKNISSTPTLLRTCLHFYSAWLINSLRIRCGIVISIIKKRGIERRHETTNTMR